MKDFKIEVKNQEESKEAQELLFELGYEWMGLRGPRYLEMHIGFKYLTAYFNRKRLAQGELGDADKEITLPQLRDMAVLHRNDVVDATHECRTDSEFKYRLISNTWHVITEHNPFWRKDSISRDEAHLFIKPIKKDKDMENLISGKEAKLAWANGGSVQVSIEGNSFEDLSSGFRLDIFDNSDCRFRLKPLIIKIGDIEVPAPFEPKVGEVFFYPTPYVVQGYGQSKYLGTINDDKYLGVWRTEDEIKQVVAAWRKLIEGAK